MLPLLKPASALTAWSRWDLADPSLPANGSWVGAAGGGRRCWLAPEKAGASGTHGPGDGFGPAEGPLASEAAPCPHAIGAGRPPGVGHEHPYRLHQSRPAPVAGPNPDLATAADVGEGPVVGPGVGAALEGHHQGTGSKAGRSGLDLQASVVAVLEDHRVEALHQRSRHDGNRRGGGCWALGRGWRSRAGRRPAREGRGCRNWRWTLGLTASADRWGRPGALHRPTMALRCCHGSCHQRCMVKSPCCSRRQEAAARRRVVAGGAA